MSLNKIPSTVLLTVLVTGLMAYGARNVSAQDEQNVFDWYYSSVFGTGIYRVGGRDVTMIRLPYERRVWESEEQTRTWLLSIPTTLGIYDFNVDDIDELQVEDVATLTVFPGLYYIIPLNRHWHIKPFLHVGYGKEFAGGEEALIYSAGVRSIGKFIYGDWRFSVGNAIYYAGNTRQGQTDLGFAGFELAFDLNYPVNWTYDDNKLRAGAYFVYYDYSDLEFIQPNTSKVQISEQFEIGFTLSSDTAMSMLGLDIDRIGIGYLFSKDFDAVRLVFSFPY